MNHNRIVKKNPPLYINRSNFTILLTLSFTLLLNSVEELQVEAGDLMRNILSESYQVLVDKRLNSCTQPTKWECF